MRRGWWQFFRRLLYACGSMAVLAWSPAMGAEPTGKPLIPYP
jgi:hypothetical protein